jgi:ABC-type cobalamin/Fe3+-siderophores transport system ATPase subunit
MTRDDDPREVDDTTIAAGGQQAWSAVGPQGEPQPPLAGDPPPADFAGSPTQAPYDAGGGQPDVAGQDPNDWDERERIRRQWDSPERGGRNWDGQDWVDSDEPDQVQSDQVVNSGHHPDAQAVISPPNSGPAELTSGREPADEPKPPPGPVLAAAGLGLLTKAGWVFQNVDLTLRPGSVAAIVGPAGTGRSCLLLALTGRMETNTGRLMVAGHLMEDAEAKIRAITAVARIGSVAVPEPGLTVRESVDERCLMDNVNAKIGRTRFNDACNAMRITFDPAALVGSLIGEQATLFAVALACVRISAVLVLDDLDRGVSAAMQQTMLDALIRLSATGPTIIVSTTDRIPVMDADVVLDLTPEEGRALWQLPTESGQVAILRQLDPAGRQRDPRPQLNSGRFMPAVPDAEIDQDAASASTELYRPDPYSGLYDDPDSPTEYYQPPGSGPTPDPTGSDPAAFDPTGGNPTGSDPTERDRPNNPDTPTTGAPTEDNR